jgi:hypothetical protein
VDLSPEKSIRKGQFRTFAKEAMASAPWGSSDPIGKVVSLLEKAYAAGAASTSGAAGAPMKEAVPWNAIPERSRDIFRHVIQYRSSWAEITNGSRLVLLDNAGKKAPRYHREVPKFLDPGPRARLGLWEVRGDRLHCLDYNPIDWAPSSASALVKLGIFEEFGVENPSARLTSLGIKTLEEAIRTETIAF